MCVHSPFPFPLFRFVNCLADDTLSLLHCVFHIGPTTRSSKSKSNKLQSRGLVYVLVRPLRSTINVPRDAFPRCVYVRSIPPACRCRRECARTRMGAEVDISG